MASAFTGARMGLRHRLRTVRLAPGDAAFWVAIAAAGLAPMAVMALLLLELFQQAWPAITRYGLGFLTETSWDPVTSVFGAAPAIYGTVVSSLLALVLAVPISLGTAIFLSELSPRLLRAPLSFLIEMLAAIPSVVYGLWGLYVLVPFIRDPVETRLGDHLGFIPLFHGPPFGVGMLAAGVLLAIMVLPIITAVARDVIAVVPDDQREAMLALGATRWEVISGAVLPYARSGIAGAVILGLGRALGETMAVTMVIGNNYTISSSLFAPGHTLASTVASEFTEATTRIYISALIELGLVLFGTTLLVNVLARLLVWRLARGGSGGRA